MVGSSHFAGSKRRLPSVSVPDCGAASPASTSSSSLCPLPDTPATPTISPARRASDTSCRRGTPCASRRHRPWACSSGVRRRSSVPSAAAPVGAPAGSEPDPDIDPVIDPDINPEGAARPSCTCRPTIACASESSVTSSMGRSSTTCPARITVTASHRASTSLSLCVISTTVVPCVRNWRKVPNRACVSWGVSTAVGSSRIRMRAPRYSVLRISRRCRSPTGRRDTGASRSTRRPVAFISTSSRVRACARARPRCQPGSAPSITLSRALKSSTSMKCWCTMPMPRAIAWLESVICTDLPSTSISPPSAGWKP